MNGRTLLAAMSDALLLDLHHYDISPTRTREILDTLERKHEKKYPAPFLNNRAEKRRQKRARSR